VGRSQCDERHRAEAVQKEGKFLRSGEIASKLDILDTTEKFSDGERKELSGRGGALF
jgi:hypothetical protein